MLKKKERLTTAMFNQYFATGRRAHGAYVQLIYAPASVFHGAAVVGKKVHKSAVARNRLRRRIYNALYAKRQQEELSGVYILIAKPTAAAATFSELQHDIAALIGRVHK